MELPTDVQKIFLLSKVNGADYYGDRLSVTRWDFPRETWLQRRLREIKGKEQADES